MKTIKYLCCVTSSFKLNLNAKKAGQTSSLDMMFSYYGESKNCCFCNEFWWAYMVIVLGLLGLLILKYA